VAKAEQPVLFFATPVELEAWIDEHGEESDGIWLKFAKKDSGIESVVYAEAVEIALSHGFTPRRSRSKWSKINRETAERLIAEGRMRAAGLREIARAKEDGRWDDAYDSPSTATVPDDFQAALDAEPAAAEFFATLGSTKRYSFLYRITDAKRPETRAKRIADYVALLARGETLS
jgi:uncharacterized protein YdeI (YjbR/CyaY-like superfamily)